MRPDGRREEDEMMAERDWRSKIPFTFLTTGTFKAIPRKARVKE